MNDAAAQPSATRRYLPLAVAVAVGVALALFAGFSAGGDGDSATTGYAAAPVLPDRAALLAADAETVELPRHPPLELSPAPAPTVEIEGRSVDLRVLLLVHGADEDAEAAAQMRETLDVVGIPHDVVFTDADTLTDAMLRDGEHGRYNGIILTDAELLTADGRSGLTRAEWALLDAYARDFSVRQAVLGGFPGSTDRYDYGMAATEIVDSPEVRWTDRASTTFASVALQTPLQVTGAAFASTPRDDGVGPSVEPLLVEATGDKVLISLLRYPDGREVVLSGISMGVAHMHSHALVYDFVRFATSGVHLGAARTHLAVHVDDLFFDYRAWDSEANEAETETTRNTPADIEAVVAHQERLAAAFETLDSFVVSFPFNGAGAALVPEGGDGTGDALTDAVLANRDRLHFLNHTYQHRDLDTSAGAGAVEAREELLWNRVMWDLLGLPGADENASVVVTGEHSGVWDDPNDGDAGAQIPYPEGLNTAMAGAFEDAGIRYLAGDASEGRQAADQKVPGYELVLLPRYPTGILLNATEPDEQVDQYNWFFHERFVVTGQDPCEVPAAACEPVDYPELLTAEAELTTRQMLSFRRWPHYFHMANVVDYDGDGSTLLGDWLDAVMTEYESRSALPVENLTFAEIGERTEAELEARAANPVGVLDIDAAEVVLAAGRDVDLAVTGLADGELYGPVRQSVVPVGREPVRFAVEG